MTNHVPHNLAHLQIVYVSSNLLKFRVLGLKELPDKTPRSYNATLRPAPLKPAYCSSSYRVRTRSPGAVCAPAQCARSATICCSREAAVRRCSGHGPADNNMASAVKHRQLPAAYQLCVYVTGM
jgi:hypothetical protein